jgi:hypothetical protein
VYRSNTIQTPNDQWSSIVLTILINRQVLRYQCISIYQSRELEYRSIATGQNAKKMVISVLGLEPNLSQPY